MKIICPKCQAAYQVDLPDLDDSGRDVQCAKCLNVFVVKPEIVEQPVGSQVSSTFTPSNRDVDVNEDSLSLDQGISQPESKGSLGKDPEIEAFLDEIIHKELEDEAENFEKNNSESSTTENPLKNDESPELENLIDEIIEEDEPSPSKETQDSDLLKPGENNSITEESSGKAEAKTETPSEFNESADPNSIKDETLDQIWEDAVQESLEQPPTEKPIINEEDIGLVNENEDFPKNKPITDPETSGSDKEESDTPNEVQPASDKDQDSSTNKSIESSKDDNAEGPSDEDLWAQAFADQDATEAQQAESSESSTAESEDPPATSEDTPASAEESSTEEPSDEDLWAQAFADQDATEAKQAESSESSTAESEEPSATSEDTPASAEESGTEEPSDEDLWAQAFADQDATEAEQSQSNETSSESSEETQPPESTEQKEKKDDEMWDEAFGEEDGDDEIQALADSANVELGNSNLSTEEPEKELPPEAFAEYEGDEDEFEFKPKKRKIGPFEIPHGKKGDMILAGVLGGFLLIAGSGYFAYKTFIPDELAEIDKKEIEIPEELSPKEVPSELLESEEGEDIPSLEEAIQPSNEELEKIKQEDNSSLKDSESSPTKEKSVEETLLQELGESKILSKAEKSEAEAAKEDKSIREAINASSTFVTLNTIMPIAYNQTDIRVLSFSLEVELSSPETADLVREALPVYEKIMITTVEKFLERKFYNDILYFKEKLQKRLVSSMNKSIRGGKVKKTKFKDFAIQ